MVFADRVRALRYLFFPVFALLLLGAAGISTAEARMYREIAATEGDPWDGFDSVGGGGGGSFPAGTGDRILDGATPVQSVPRALPCLISGNHIILLDLTVFRPWSTGSELGELFLHQTGRGEMVWPFR